MAESEFQGTARFVIQRRLGVGGMGIVYEALDRDTNTRVALKTLRSPSPQALVRLKREFRALQDLQHPNLVGLGELIEARGVWFFTMELVHGVTLLDYVRHGGASSERTGRVQAQTETSDPPASGVSPEAPTHDASWPTAPARSVFDAAAEARLRDALAQLARGLGALHGAGKVHRDVKPSNILVTREGRVVLLDFGLITDADAGHGAGWTDVNVVGTALYMAPEQAIGRSVGPEADWYSVGVILYEALTGVPPFLGPNLQVLMEKQRRDPVAARTLAPETPEDLDALASELLRVDPARRPSGPAISQRLGVGRDTGQTTVPVVAQDQLRNLAASLSLTQTPPFVGRTAELASLRAALEDTRRGVGTTVLVHGQSGIGKSALVRRFVEDAAADEHVLCLAGRCYERESVPYKAIDGVVDALARHMQRLARYESAALIPNHAPALLRVFPVLKHVDVLSDLPGKETDDPQELRARVFAAFRELLARLGARRTLIVVIDDLQWGDADSLALLSELLRPPEAPRLLLIATWRETGTDPGSLPFDVRRLRVDPLPAEEARRLAGLLCAATGAAEQAAEEIARESEGNPLFVDELVRYVAMHGYQERPLHLDEALRTRIALLEAPVRLVLEILAVAGVPLEQETVARACGIELGELGRSAAVLRVANLARTSGARGVDLIEYYHDRVREAVVHTIAPATLEKRHHELARALEASGHADLEALALHHLAAGQREKAASYALDAAALAQRVLAFDRAVRLYRVALELLPQADPSARSLRIRLAEALAQAGRGAEAAGEYLGAAVGATRADALDLQRRAAWQYLVAGHIDDGLATLREVLASQGMTYPRTPRRALLSLVGRRAWLRFRGLGFRERDESQISPEALARIDLHWDLGTTLGVVDTIRGHHFQVRGLLLALRAGEPYRIARALAVDSVFLGTAGGPATQAVLERVQVAETLARKTGNAHALALIFVVRGTTEFLSGRFQSALTLCREAETLYRDGGLTQHVELGTVRGWIPRSLHWLGRLGELAEYVPQMIKECDERGDVFVGTTLRTTTLPIVRLAADDPRGASDAVDEGLRRWSPQRFHLQHYYALLSAAAVDLYVGDAERALRRVEGEWPEVSSSHLLRIQAVRIPMLDLRARALLAVAALPGATRDEPRRLRTVLAEARRIEKERMPWSTPLALLVRAGAAVWSGDQDTAARDVRAAALGFDTADMGLHAAAARRRLGQLLGGDEGRSFVQAADAWMAGQGIKDAGRMTAVLAPGFKV